MTPEDVKKDRDKWEAHALRLEEEMMRLRKEITTRQENNFGLHRRNVRLQTELCAAKCTLAKWIEWARMHGHLDHAAGITVESRHILNHPLQYQ